MDALTAGDLDPMPLVSHRLPLEDAAHGYELFDRREATKVLLIP
jgi:threonine dehydrogenase-like Zn-dependent dehydrogenase